MKKKIFSWAVMLMGALVMTACDESDNENPYYPVLVSDGAYVVCGGNQYSNITSSLTYVDYASGTAAQNQFRAKNGREMGMTANDAMIYGSKMYIVVDAENTVEVVDAQTLKSLKQIKLTDLMGAEKGAHPRHITYYNGCIYVSTYGSSTADWSAYTTTGNGYVAAIDTLSYGLTKTYTAGSFPEGLCVTNGKLYVANSDYSMCQKASISVIDLQSGIDTPYTSDQIVNPTLIGVTTEGMYVLDMGNYGDIASGMRKVSASGVKTLFDCTHVYYYGSYIYAINSVYGTIPTEFMVYDITSGVTFTASTGLGSKFFSPNVIAADPVTGKIYIASYNEDPSNPGYASYSTDGYVLEYAADGTLLNTYDCGVGPNAIVFNTNVKYIKSN